MSELAHADSFRDLVTYQKARTVARHVFKLSSAFPKDEAYSLTDQIRRSSRSVGGQIAEAWGKRRYSRHFVSKLTDADAEQLETQHWIEVALDCGYVSPDQCCEVLNGLQEIGRMINAMILKADQFCGPPDTDH